MERGRPPRRWSRSGSRSSRASGRRSTGRRGVKMARKKLALAQNATETRVLPAEVVRPVFLTKRAQERALEQEQEERTWDRAADVGKAGAASPGPATGRTLLPGGVG